MHWQFYEKELKLKCQRRPAFIPVWGLSPPLARSTVWRLTTPWSMNPSGTFGLCHTVSLSFPNWQYCTRIDLTLLLIGPVGTQARSAYPLANQISDSVNTSQWVVRCSGSVTPEWSWVEHHGLEVGEHNADWTISGHPCMNPEQNPPQDAAAYLVFFHIFNGSWIHRGPVLVISQQTWQRWQTALTLPVDLKYSCAFDGFGLILRRRSVSHDIVLSFWVLVPTFTYQNSEQRASWLSMVEDYFKPEEPLETRTT